MACTHPNPSVSRFLSFCSFIAAPRAVGSPSLAKRLQRALTSPTNPPKQSSGQIQGKVSPATEGGTGGEGGGEDREIHWQISRPFRRGREEMEALAARSGHPSRLAQVVAPAGTVPMEHNNDPLYHLVRLIPLPTRAPIAHRTPRHPRHVLSRLKSRIARHSTAQLAYLHRTNER